MVARVNESDVMLMLPEPYVLASFVTRRISPVGYDAYQIWTLPLSSTAENIRPVPSFSHAARCTATHCCGVVGFTPPSATDTVTRVIYAPSTKAASTISFPSGDHAGSYNENRSSLLRVASTRSVAFSMSATFSDVSPLLVSLRTNASVFPSGEIEALPVRLSNTFLGVPPSTVN